MARELCSGDIGRGDGPVVQRGERAVVVDAPEVGVNVHATLL